MALLWALVLSLHVRCSMVNHGGDDYLRLMLFWGAFAPCGDVASVDAFLAGTMGGSSDNAAAEKPPDSGQANPARPTRGSSAVVLSLSTAALALQTPLLYLHTALKKVGPEWWDDLSAVELVM